MARRESDREDLLREATALVERAELRLKLFREPVLVGFRRGGAASFFFGGDPVYQFNSACQLRRAFIAGKPMKAERGRLISLARERTATETALVRSELDSTQQALFLELARQQLHSLARALDAGEYEVIGVIPPDSSVVRRVRAWLEGLGRGITVAQRPNVQQST
jgi:hypothetical protein